MGISISIGAGVGSGKPPVMGTGDFDAPAWVVAHAVVYWPMEGDNATLTDVTGRGNDLSNFALSGAPGLIGQATNYGASDGSYCTRPSTSDLQIGAGDFIIAAWVKPSSFPDLVTVAGKWGLGSFEYGLGIADDATPFWRVSADGATADYAGDDPLTADEWALLIGRYSAANGKLYLRVNNRSVIEAAHGGGVHTGAADFAVGTDANGAFFDGLIDDTIIFKSATPLSDDDFNALCVYLWNGGGGQDLSALF